MRRFRHQNEGVGGVAATARLGTGGRAWRAVATAVGAGLLVAGSLWGSDDHFPFGPFRMYATSGRQNGTVRTATLTAVVAGGEQRRVEAPAVGMRRAELEGQFPRFREDPALLGNLAARFEERHGVRLVALVLEERVRRVVEGEVQPGVEHRVVASWERTGP